MTTDLQSKLVAQWDAMARQARIDESPVKVGDRVVRRTGKTAVGIVRYVYLHNDRLRAAVDWPAPNHIGGDGWHRSSIYITSLETT